MVAHAICMYLFIAFVMLHCIPIYVSFMSPSTSVALKHPPMYLFPIISLHEPIPTCNLILCYVMQRWVSRTIHPTAVILSWKLP